MMEQKHIVAMEDLHKKHSDIDDFLGETVSYIKENNISDDDFFAWWEQVDLSNEPTATGEDEKASSFLNDMVPKRVRRWWTEQQGGTILLTIRYGNKVIELEQGKIAIELSSKAELEPTLQSIKKAVDNGEFDALLEEQLAYGSHLKKYL